MKAKSTFSLKDQPFNGAKVDYLATLFAGVYPVSSTSAAVTPWLYVAASHLLRWWELGFE